MMLPENRAFEAAKPADDHDDQCEDENVPLGAGIECQECTACDAGRAREKRRKRGDQHEQPVDVDAGRVDHFAVVDACAHDRADLRLVIEQPQQDRGECSEHDQREAIFRIEQPAGQRHAAAQPGRRLDAQVVAAPDRQAHLADDERDADGEQHLRKMVMADRANEKAVDDKAERHDCEAATQDRQLEAAGAAHDRIADVAAEQVVRAVRHVHDTHQAERQREPARKQEQQRGKRDAVDRLKDDGGHVRPGLRA